MKITYKKIVDILLVCPLLLVLSVVFVLCGMRAELYTFIMAHMPPGLEYSIPGYLFDEAASLFYTGSGLMLLAAVYAVLRRR